MATGAPLQFRGEFYTHTLMTPFFTPPAADLDGLGVPKIFLAGVGELMTEVAGEVCDGFLCHGFTTEKYLREVTIPALERGRAKAGKTMDGFQIVGPSFVVTGTNDAEMAAAAAGTRQQIAFYGSTPAYRAVLDVHGWGGLQEELNGLSKQGEWVRMGELIDDEILNTFAVVGPPEAIAPELHRRYGDVVDRVSFYAPYRSDPERWARCSPRSRRRSPTIGCRSSSFQRRGPSESDRLGSISAPSSQRPDVGAEGVVGVAALLEHHQWAGRARRPPGHSGRNHRS